MKIPTETIELIRTRLDIVELVGERVQLTRAGRNMKGRCPFHQERTPSFVVSPERQTFHCFGCGEGGDAFSFVMKSEGLGFMEAAEKLADRAGVKLEADRALSEDDKLRLKLREANEFAAQHYHEVLKKDPSAEAARNYVGSRKLNRSSVDGFLLGYAPRNGNLVAAAGKKGFTPEILLKAGLAAKRPDGSLRDYFFDRLLFPIRDVKGGFVGFGGRTLGDGEPKYLNTSETPVFAKSRVLYGLHEGLADVRKARKAQLMEGYMDVIATHQHGLKTACAPLGTALTPEHAALIKRYADAVTIVFDADNAGQNAAVRGAEVALEAGLGTRVATVPSGKDPDEFLHVSGLDAFKAECLEAAVDLVAFKTELLVKRAGELTPEAKSAIAKDVLGTIARCPDEVLKDEWVRRLAQRLGLTEDSLRRAGGKAIPQSSPRKPSAAPAPAPGARVAAARLSGADGSLLQVLTQAPSVLAEAVETDFDGETARALYRALKAALPADAGWPARVLEAAAEPALHAAASALFVAEAPDEDPAAAAREKLLRRRTQLEADRLKASAASATTLDAQMDSLKRLAALKRSSPKTADASEEKN